VRLDGMLDRGEVTIVDRHPDAPRAKLVVVDAEAGAFHSVLEWMSDAEIEARAREEVHAIHPVVSWWCEIAHGRITLVAECSGRWRVEDFAKLGPLTRSSEQVPYTRIPGHRSNRRVNESEAWLHTTPNDAGLHDRVLRLRRWLPKRSQPTTAGVIGSMTCECAP
jgi:hypothetical protein